MKSCVSVPVVVTTDEELELMHELFGVPKRRKSDVDLDTYKHMKEGSRPEDLSYLIRRKLKERTHNGVWEQLHDSEKKLEWQQVRRH